MAAGDMPTHRLKAKERDPRGRHSEVGIGWIDEETGALRISLYPGVTLSWRDNDDLMLTLFPIRAKESK